jgi:hypothetical protein
MLVLTVQPFVWRLVCKTPVMLQTQHLHRLELSSLLVADEVA